MLRQKQAADAAAEVARSSEQERLKQEAAEAREPDEKAEEERVAMDTQEIPEACLTLFLSFSLSLDYVYM